jgi:hypothetical protein
MTTRKRAAVLAVALILGLIAGLAVRANAAHDGGTDQAWVPAMNQPSYWEDVFGPGATCDKFDNHNGNTPAGYEAAVVKDGTRVRVYVQPGPFLAAGPINPANGKHHGSPHSWVMKCNVEPPEDTTTTTAPEDTTTTEPETTTTTEPDTTTTTAPEDTTTTDPETTTVPEVEPTVTVPPPAPPAPDPVPEAPAVLPFTGPAPIAGLAGLGAVLIGGGLALIRRRGE